MINWLLENETFEENLDKIKEIITKQGMKYQICNNLPFYGKITFENKIPIIDGSIYKNKPLFAYGSLQLIKRLQKSNFSVVTFCNFKQFKCSYYYPRFGKYLLQEQYAFVPFGEFDRRKEWLFQHLGQQNQIFVRPDDGFKTFTGQLVSKERWDKDMGLIGFYDVQPECMCIVSEPKNIKNEWRFVIGTDFPSDEYPQRIISGSCYKINGNLVENPNDEIDQYVIDYVNEVISNVNYRPDPFWILDVCLTDKLNVLEVGSMSCSGLYGCDLNKVISNIADFLTAEWLEMKGNV